MKRRNTAPLGRNIIDIDGRLRATDRHSLSADDVLELLGRAAWSAQVFVEAYGQTTLLCARDRIELTAHTVAFFHTREISQMRHLNTQGAGSPSAALSLAA